MVGALKTIEGEEDNDHDTMAKTNSHMHFSIIYSYIAILHAGY